MATTGSRARGLRNLSHAVTLAVAFALLVPGAALADATITSAGPLTSVGITSDLNCSVNHTGDTAGEFYGDTACATLVASGGTLYGPANIPAGGNASPLTAYTPVSQSSVTGSGTNASPYQILTVVDLGTSGLRIHQTDSYVVGEESYRTDIQLENTSNASANAIIYHAGDCFLANSDTGYGAHDLTTGSVTCVESVDNGSGGTMPGTRIEQFLPLSAGSHSYEDAYSTVWAKIGSQAPFDDTCACDQDIDNGAGLSWSVTVPANSSVTKSNLITFSPTGKVPLITTKTADNGTVATGGSDGYTITLSNPNTSAVSLNTITDTLPTGFSYTAGSSTGVTTTDPGISGQTLTWTGPFNVPASSGGSPGTVTLHFNVTASSTAGDYFNNAGGTSTDYTVAPTGDTAKVTVVSTHTLTVSKSGTGTGTVTSSPSGISCGATCSHDYAGGTVVTLTATPTTGSVFTGWSGGGCSGTGTCVVTLNANTTVTATFATAHTLTVSKAGTGSGTVTSSPSGINCGATCAAQFADGTVVTLTATPAAHSTFTGWSGGGCSGTGTCIVTLSADTTVTATFTQILHTLTVSKSGSGTGTVTSSPAGIDCGATCSHDYVEGTLVTLTATPATGSVFTGWSGGGCSGTGTCTVTLNANTTVTANFAALHTLTVSEAGTGSGSVSSSPAGIDCGATCAAQFADGTVITLTATAASGSTFDGWSGGGCSGTGTCVVTLNADTTVTATFTANPVPPAVPSIAIGSANVDPEGNSGSVDATFTVQLSGPTTQTVTVDYATADGSATAGLDYTATSGTLTFTPGQTQLSIAVPVLGDLIPEPDETFTVNLSAPVNATIGVAQGTGTIVDDDQIGSTGGAFCGTQHRGKCTGLKIKDQFDRPGNASWTFAAYNPPPGHAGRAMAAASKKIKLGTVKKKVGKGKVTVVFKLKGSKADRLLQKIAKAKLKFILITRTFKPANGPVEIVTKTIRLKP